MTRHWIVALSLFVSSIVWADSEIDNLSSLDQASFKDLSSDLGAALGYKAINPGQPLGSMGFDLGFEISSTRMETDALELSTSGDAPGDLLLPKIHLIKGLPYGIDVGGFYTALPSSNIALLGGELGYEVYEGSSLSPTVSIRGTYTRLTGVDDLSLSTRGLELSISKGFAFFTPYAGIGQVWIDSDSTVTGLQAESLREQKYFMGFNLNLGLMNFAAETEQTGDNATTSAKIGARF